ncbi:unnamed protein product, partial [Ixodes persulcatus]
KLVDHNACGECRRCTINGVPIPLPGESQSSQLLIGQTLSTTRNVLSVCEFTMGSILARTSHPQMDRERGFVVAHAIVPSVSLSNVGRRLEYGTKMARDLRRKRGLSIASFVK